MQAPENLVVRGLVMIDDSRRLPWGRDKNFVCVCVYVLCMFFSAVISPEHWENVFSTNCNGPVWFTLKTTLGKYLYWTWNPTNLLESTFRANLSELRYPFWVDYYLTYLTTTNFYDQPMFESRNICDLGLLQNARTHGPRGTVKTIEKYFLHRTQVHYFCSGNSNQDKFVYFRRFRVDQ